MQVLVGLICPVHIDRHPVHAIQVVDRNLQLLQAPRRFFRAGHSAGDPVLDLAKLGDKAVCRGAGADETNARLELIKGGGGALTREKIVAAVARKFLCIVDQSKKVDLLGSFPLPVEVIPMARSYVAREIVKLGGDPVYREGCVTDNGNHILDIYNLEIVNPRELEQQLNQITGVVTNGLFAERGADRLILGTSTGVKTYLP